MAEQNRSGAFLSSEQSFGNISRDQVNLVGLNDSATTLLAGTVLGQQNVGTVAAFANAAANTGNGTCGTITLSSGVQEGVYTFEAVTAGTTALFQAQAPNGTELPTMKVGTAYSGGGLAFTITSGGTAYAIGDQLTITVGTGTFANGGSNTGNGTCGAIVIQTGVVGGTYKFTAIDATHFTGVDPNGVALPNLTVGTQYNAGGLTFTITAGGTAYVAGDTFTIVTATGSLNYKQVSASATDGTQVAAGILLSPVYVGGSTAVPAAIVARFAEVKSGLLIWPSGATDDQIRVWTAQLAAKLIVVRSSLI